MCFGPLKSKSPGCKSFRGINGHAKIIIPIHFRIMHFLGNLKGWTFARRMPRNRHHCWHYLLAMFVFDSPIAVAVAVAAAINVN